jgi:ferric-chelate reductase (NADPH)
MIRTTEFPLQSDATLPGLAFAAMRSILLHEAQEHELPIVTDTDDRITMRTYYGMISFAAVSDGITVSVSADKPDRLFTLKESLVEHLLVDLPDIAVAMRWSDGDKAGAQPPNFQLATVLSTQPIGESFVRVRMKLRDLSSFQDDAIHFRLVLPPKGLDDVEWPYVSANGSTVWPKGDKALHRPVYTSLKVDHTVGEMEFDVFVHEGGRVTEWAQSVLPGAQVAVAGPGGGGVPDTSNIMMFGDETAFPAIARILSRLPKNTTGQVTLLAEKGSTCSYPFTAPTGIRVNWISAEANESLADLALKARKQFPEHFLWFACEKTDVLRVRAAYKSDGADAANAYIAAYWNRV